VLVADDDDGSADADALRALVALDQPNGKLMIVTVTQKGTNDTMLTDDARWCGRVVASRWVWR